MQISFSRWIIILPALATALIVVLTSSTSAATTPSEAASPSGPASEPEDSKSPIAQTESSGDNEKIQQARAQIMNVERAPDSGLTSFTIRVVNDDSENIHDNEFESDTYLYYYESFNGVSATSGQTKYHPVMDKETHCLCSGYASREPYAAFVKPDQFIDYWAMFEIPRSVKKVDVKIPGFDPIEDVPVE